MELKAKYQSSPNIAWVKYWGKFDEEYILPINDSLGLTLNSQQIKTTTSIIFSHHLEHNTLLLNEEKHPISKRLQKILKIIKSKAYERKYKDKISLEEWESYHFQINSVNSFPTASGMASSASGLACLAAALNGLFEGILDPSQLSQLARLGSGSASRSVYGGLVRWKGVPRQILPLRQKLSQQQLNKLSKQCISETIFPQKSLQYIKVIALLAHKKQKQISSTSGMQQSVETSSLIKHRNTIANQRIELILSCLEEISKAQNEKNQELQMKWFNILMEEIMKDSNQFHAICLDTYPPIFYLNEFSKQIIYIVNQILNKNQGFKVSYTFDAGPHAFLFVHQQDYGKVLQYFVQLFGISVEKLNGRGRQLYEKQNHKLNYPKYEGNLIEPNQIWVTQAGYGCKQIN